MSWLSEVSVRLEGSMWRLLTSGTSESTQTWDDVLPRLAMLVASLKYAAIADLVPYCGTCLKLTRLALACAAKVDVDYYRETMLLAAPFQRAEKQLDAISETCASRRLGGKFFQGTYRYRVAGALHEVAQGVTAVLNAVQETSTIPEDLSDICDRIEDLKREHEKASTPPRDSLALDQMYDAMVADAQTITEDTVDRFLDSAKRFAMAAGVVSDDIDMIRQMLAIREDQRLRDDIAAALVAAQGDVEDDEDFLRTIVDYDEIQQHDALAHRQMERDEARDQLAIEKALLDAVSVAVAGTTTPVKRRPSISMPRFDPPKSEAARLDAETAKLVAETAMLELEELQTDDKLVQQRRLYEQALQQRKKVEERQRRKSFDQRTETGSVSTISEHVASFVSSNAPTQSINTHHVDDDSEVRDVCAQLTVDPCDNARRARAASRLADLLSSTSLSPQKLVVKKDTARRAGAIRVLATMLNMHVKQPELDAFARALSALAAQHQANKVAILESGALATIVGRVADSTCDNRHLVPLWRTLAHEPTQYRATLEDSAEAVVELLVHVNMNSYAPDEQLLATRSLLVLLTAEEEDDVRLLPLVREHKGLHAMTGVLDRKLAGGDDDADAVQTAHRTKETAVKAALLLLVSDDPSLPKPQLHEIFTIEGAARTLAVFAGSPRYFNLASAASAGEDADAAVLAILRELFEYLIAAARKDDALGGPSSEATRAVAEIVNLLSNADDQLPASWTIREQAAKALRKLVKLSDDADKHHDAHKQLLAVNARPPRASRVAALLSSRGAIRPLVSFLKYHGPATKRVVFAKTEAARVLRSIADHHPPSIQTMVDDRVIPALLTLVEIVNKDDPKEAGITALWALCKDSKVTRDVVVKNPNGIKTVMSLVARTGTNAGDEAAARLLASIVGDDPNNDRYVKTQRDVYTDMMRTLEWNVAYGDTVHVKGAAKVLRDILKSSPSTTVPPGSVPVVSTPRKHLLNSKLNNGQQHKKKSFPLFIRRKSQK